MKYVTYRKDRNRHGGGIVVYVRDTIQSSLHLSLTTPTDTELLWISIQISHTKYTFGAFYRPPSSAGRYYNFYIDIRYGQNIDILRTFDLQLHPQLTIYRMFENTTESLFYRFVLCIYDGKSI